jgi:non-specific serine/threonine protein kinase
VRSLITSACAICRFVRPCYNNAATSRSRVVSAPTAGGVCDTARSSMVRSSCAPIGRGAPAADEEAVLGRVEPSVGRGDAAHEVQAARTLNALARNAAPAAGYPGVQRAMATTAGPEPFAVLLRRYRAAAGLSQEELAERAGLSRRGISDLERGARRTPYPATVRRLAKALVLEDAEREALLASSGRRPAGAQAQLARSAGASLPIALTSFVGREREMAEVRRLLQTARLLTLTGTGGVGKTRLALQVAAQLLGEYPERVWFIDLAPLADGALVARAVAAVLGVQEESTRPLTDTLADVLGLRSGLLLLDNCEHVVEACATLADRLLRACWDLRILATSREALCLAGETAWRVPTLPCPDPHHPSSVDELPGYAAVRLFVERAQAVEPDFGLTEQNSSAVAGACARLGGLPLAIELAAARVPMLSPEQIFRRLDDALALLVGGSRSAPTRQQTLRATLDWSYHLLSRDEQRLFGRLAVFAGGWTLEAAETVCAGDGIEGAEVLDILGQLVSKSLVATETSPRANVRYRLHETLRQYARGQLVTRGESDRLDRRHARYFLEFVEEAEPHLVRREQVAWLERLDRERENLRTALGWTVQHQDADTGLRLAGSLWRYWQVRGDQREGRAWLEQILEMTDPHAAPRPERAKALAAAGALSRAQGDLALARPWLEESLALLRQLGDKKSLGFVLNELGLVAVHRGELVRAAEHLEESVALRREVGDGRGLAFSLANLGNVARRQGDNHKARALFEQALALGREHGDRQGMGQALVALAEIERQHGDLERAGQLLEESLGLSRELGDTRGTAFALGYLGRVTHELGNDERARLLHQESLRLNRDSGDMPGIARCLYGFADLAAAHRRFDRAARLLGGASRLAEARGWATADDDDHKRAERAARGHLGDAAFASAWAAGRNRALEETIGEALADEASDPITLRVT